MERVIVLSDLQRHMLPQSFVGTPEGDLILSMTHEVSRRIAPTETREHACE